VIRRDKLETLGEDFEAIVNRVSGALTDDAMVAMNAAVDIEQQDPATVAEAFLEANDLLG
jgi:glycine betaine/choline ABC-type transport system substrate-binding protein